MNKITGLGQMAGVFLLTLRVYIKASMREKPKDKSTPFPVILMK
jgi:hypothetical protein